MKITNLIALATLSASSSIFACSTFQLENSTDAIMAKSYDYDTTTGYAFLNTRGRVKTAIFTDLKHLLKAKKWTAKYGSVSFTQANQEIAFSGMNEEGLATEFLDLDETIYPAYDKSKKYISEAQIGQYLLDNASNVKEAIALLEETGVAKLGAYLHTFICDASKECAAIEFMNGKMVVSTGASMPVKAITNTNYVKSLATVHEANLARLHDYEGTTMDDRSIARFKLVSEASVNYDGKTDPVAYALKALDSVRMNNPSTEFNKRLEKTQWNIVYNQTAKKIYFKTTAAPTLKEIDFSGLDFSCSKEVKFYNMNTDFTGNVTELFKPITMKDRKDLINQLSVASSFQKLVVPYTSSITKCEK